MTTVVLKALEDRLGKPLHQHFDLIAGTSVGAIVGCTLGHGRTTDEAKHIFETEIAGTFQRKPGSKLTRAVRAVKGKAQYCDMGVSQQTILSRIVLPAVQELAEREFKGVREG